MEFKIPTRDQRALARRITNASNCWPVKLVAGRQTPRIKGDPAHYTNKSGDLIYHPAAYSKKAYRMYYHYSTRRVEVGVLWLLSRSGFHHLTETMPRYNSVMYDGIGINI